MPAHLPPSPPAIRLLTGSRLWVDDGRKGHLVDSEAVAIQGAKIQAVGPLARLMKRYPKAIRVELKGGSLMPGFIESHAHVGELGTMSRQADLTGIASKEEALARVETWCAANPAGWVRARGWDQNLWPTKAFPTLKELDAITGNRPAYLERVDGHAAWVNTAAMKLAGITKDTPDPAGGRYIRDADGNPTGVLVDMAKDAMAQKLPQPTLAEAEANLLAGLRKLEALGFTSADDLDAPGLDIEAYRALQAKGKLPIRVFAYVHHDDAAAVQAELAKPRARALSFFQVQGVKFYMDGALGSRGARLLASYADEPSSSGLWVMDPAMVRKDALAVMNAGYQPALHAIGDAGNRAALDLLEADLKALGRKPDAPPRIEHAQIVTDEDAARFGRLGIVASVQPMHCTDDHAWTPARLGADWVHEAYPWRRFLDSGGLVAFGSDAPIADANPFMAMPAAETRQDIHSDPPGGFNGDQCMTREETIRAYTLNGAEALGRKGQLGRIAPGEAADLVWVDADIEKTAPKQMLALKPGRMWVAGVEAALPR
ncbi:MAG TPA: amidohydrolase [Holophagaceae bacterium]|jgi:predicted amidohydrolase YtcJ|nr:amidohydrolase [Holophagaceae bacterium]